MTVDSDCFRETSGIRTTKCFYTCRLWNDKNDEKFGFKNYVIGILLKSLKIVLPIYSKIF